MIQLRGLDVLPMLGIVIEYYSIPTEEYTYTSSWSIKRREVFLW